MTEKAKSDIIKAIKNASNIIILTHYEPDGDALGSAIAIARGLEAVGKKVAIPSIDEFPERYRFMSKYWNHWDNSVDKPDIAIVLDSSKYDRINSGKIDVKSLSCPLINIDHHSSNSLFGNLNWVDTDASATGEIIYSLMLKLDLPIDTISANALYIAIMTDTGRFAFGNTTAESLRISSELVKLGANPEMLTNWVYFSYSEEYLRNIGIALFNARSYKDGRILFLTLDQACAKFFSTSLENSEGIIDFAMGVQRVEVAALFKEISSQKVHVSFRSRRGIDINTIAEYFGGGGHPNAAGCTVETDLITAQKTVLEHILRLLGYK